MPLCFSRAIKIMLLASAFLPALYARADETVVVYTSVDLEFAAPLLREAAAETKLDIKPVFDAEAAKTVGLERRLVSERKRPRADVFWNSEYLRTLKLGQEGILAPRPGDVGAGIPPAYDAGEFIGFGVRARVLAINTDKLSPDQAPQTLEALADPQWKGRVAIAKPLFGTTSTHFAALYAKWGEARFIAFLKALKANDVMILPGNGDVRDAVAEGRIEVGLTDTDDAVGAVRRKQPLAIVFLDQTGDGAFAVFQTVAMIKNGPNPEAARVLVNYLTSPAAEARLVELGAVQIPVREDLPMAPELGGKRPRLWHVSDASLLDSLAPSIKLIQQYLL